MKEYYEAMNGLSVGIVVGNLQQGGSERYTFELAKALQKANFRVTLIVPMRVLRREHFYVARIKEQGIRIEPELPWLYKTNLIPKPLMNQAWTVFRLLNRRRLKRARNSLESFDVISVIQVEMLVYLIRARLLTSTLIVHLMSHRIQYVSNPYEEIGLARCFLFVCMDETQQQELTSLHGEESHSVVVPLFIQGSEFQVVPVNDTDKTRVAVFIRLSAERVIKPLFYAFELLTKKTWAELYIFGSGHDQSLIDLVHALGLTDKVHFMGHSSNMRESIVEHKINLSFSVMIDGTLGYSSIELALLGVPMVFFNAGELTDEQITSRYGEIFEVGNSAERVGQLGIELANSERRRRHAVDSLRTFVQQRHSLEFSMREISRIYRDVAAKNSMLSEGAE